MYCATINGNYVIIIIVMNFLPVEELGYFD